MFLIVHEITNREVLPFHYDRLPYLLQFFFVLKSILARARLDLGSPPWTFLTFQLFLYGYDHPTHI